MDSGDGRIEGRKYPRSLRTCQKTRPRMGTTKGRKNRLKGERLELFPGKGMAYCSMTGAQGQGRLGPRPEVIQGLFGPGPRAYRQDSWNGSRARLGPKVPGGRPFPANARNAPGARIRRSPGWSRAVSGIG